MIFQRILRITVLTLCSGFLLHAEENLNDAPAAFLKSLAEANGAARQGLLSQARSYRPNGALLTEIRKSFGSAPEEAVGALDVVRKWRTLAAPLTPDLQKLIENQNEELAAYAACTLAMVSPNECPGADIAIEKLMRRVLAGSKNSLCLKFSLIALTNIKIDPKNAPALGAAYAEILKDKRFRSSEPLFLAFSRLGTPVVEQLRALLRTGSVWERRAALYALAFMGPRAQEALPEIVTFLDTEDANLRQPVNAAAVALKPDDPRVQGRINDVFASIDKTEKELDYMPHEDREGVLFGLRCGGAASIPLLVKALSTPIKELGKTCEWRLKMWLPADTDSLLPALLAQASSEDPKVRNGSLQILSKLEGAAKDALPTLEALLLKSPQDVELQKAVAAIKAANSLNILFHED